MKDCTRAGVALQIKSLKREEKEAVSDVDEELFWRNGLLGQSTAKSLLNSIYFYNGKIFGLRGEESLKFKFDKF